MKKGYTLVELLAVIVILGIILSIVTLYVMKYYNSRKQRDWDNIQMIIVENAKVLLNTDTKISVEVNDRLQEIEDACTGSTCNITCNISYGKLIDAGLMDRDTKNPTNNKNINSNSYIKITVDSNYDYNYEFVYVGDNTPMTNNCLTD